MHCCFVWVAAKELELKLRTIVWVCAKELGFLTMVISNLKSSPVFQLRKEMLM